MRLPIFNCNLGVLKVIFHHILQIISYCFQYWLEYDLTLKVYMLYFVYSLSPLIRIVLKPDTTIASGDYAISGDDVIPVATSFPEMTSFWATFKNYVEIIWKFLDKYTAIRVKDYI
jgi:hypothetical protein